MQLAIGLCLLWRQRTLATATAEAVADAVPEPEPWVFTLAEV